MADIKRKKKSDVKIKKLEKAKIYTQKLKKNIVNVKEKTDNSKEKREESSPTEYGINQITEKSRKITTKGIDKFHEYGEISVKETEENVQELTQRIKKKIQNKNIKKGVKTIKGMANEKVKSEPISKTIKTTNLKIAKRQIKNVPKTAEKTMKTVKKTTQEATKGLKKAYQVAKMTTEKTVQGIKMGIKATISAVRAIIESARALIMAIIAGGWVAVIIIMLVCVIGLICSSAVGIFFSNEDVVGSRKMSSVVSEINAEFVSRMAELQNSIEHDDYEINSNRAEWKDVIAIYAALVTNGKEQSDVITLDDERVEKLKCVFWEMNTISSRIEEVEKDIETVDENGNVVIVRVARKVLYIDITSKSVEEMAQIHNFNKKQRIQLAELQKEKYNSLWSKVLYGASAGSSDIVQVALLQIGNVGGEPFWSWYGFSSRVEWCACFVSWCANQCGYIDNGIIPKFAACQNEGVAWFKTCGLWQERGYTPNSRRYYIF